MFSRYTSLYYTPDPLGDLLFNGIAQTAAALGVVQRRADRRQLAGHRSAHAARRLPGHRRAHRLEHRCRRCCSTDASGAQPGDCRSRSTTAPARPAGSTASICRTNGSILPRVTLNYGARFDVVDEFTHENQLSPRVNVVWQADRQHHAPCRLLALFHAAAVRAGRRQRRSAPFANTTRRATRDPGQRRQGRARQLFRRRRRARSSARPAPSASTPITSRRTNLIDEGQFGAPIILTPFNYAKARCSGIEADRQLRSRALVALWQRRLFARDRQGHQLGAVQFSAADELAYICQHYIYLDHDQSWTGSGGAAYTLFTRRPAPARAFGRPDRRQRPARRRRRAERPRAAGLLYDQSLGRCRR